MQRTRGMSSLSTHKISQYVDPGSVDPSILRLHELHRAEAI
jgi:hypothetical protein